MSFSREMILSGIVSMTLVAGSASAWAQPAESGDDWLRQRAHALLRQGDAMEAALRKMARPFWNTDVDGGGVTEADHRLHEKISQADRRGRRVWKWLISDLDGDGVVTRAELEAIYGKQARQPLRSHGVELIPTEEQVRQTLDKLVRDALKVDADGNGTITLTEALRAAEAEISKRRRYSSTRHLVPLSLDRDGDGTVSRGEYREAVERVLRAIDQDGDGLFSSQELVSHGSVVKQLKTAARKAERERRRTAREQERIAACSFPKAPADAKLVLLGTYEGLALSNVGLGGDDVTVTVANAWIEPGPEPLYVVISSYSAMIWQFSGAVDRIAALVATSIQAGADRIPRVGVIGVPRERVHIPRQRGCLPYFSKAGNSKAARADGMLSRLAGRSADMVLGSYGVSSVSLPGGVFDKMAVYRDTVALPQTGPGAPLWREMLRYNPGGLARIDAKSVVSPVVAKAYGVLPQQAGLAQLVEAGALSVVGKSNVISLGRSRIVLGGGRDKVETPEGSRAQISQVPSEFLIARKIRFPAGLSGAHSVRFLLGRGVPPPEGDPGHSCVIDQATGRPTAASRTCR